MPHWNGTVETASPPILEECNGDPVRVRDKIMAVAPQGANVRVISWEDGKDKARVTVEGPEREDLPGRHVGGEGRLPTPLGARAKGPEGLANYPARSASASRMYEAAPTRR